MSLIFVLLTNGFSSRLAARGGTSCSTETAGSAAGAADEELHRSWRCRAEECAGRRRVGPGHWENVAGKDFRRQEGEAHEAIAEGKLTGIDSSPQGEGALASLVEASARDSAGCDAVVRTADASARRIHVDLARAQPARLLVAKLLTFPGLTCSAPPRGAPGFPSAGHPLTAVILSPSCRAELCSVGWEATYN